MNEAVTDAGPPIHLAEINSLDFLRVFDVVHIPDAVWSECVRPDRVSEAALRQFDNLRRHALASVEVSRFIAAQSLTQLHAGEQEALCLAHKLAIPVILTDDLAVRDVAKQLSLKPVGTLGMVVRAYQQGQLTLTEAEQRITALYTASSLFVTWAIVELAIEQLHRRSE